MNNTLTFSSHSIVFVDQMNAPKPVKIKHGEYGWKILVCLYATEDLTVHGFINFIIPLCLQKRNYPSFWI